MRILELRARNRNVVAHTGYSAVQNFRVLRSVRLQTVELDPDFILSELKWTELNWTESLGVQFSSVRSL